jgi:cytochrome c oxidase subunit 2
MKKKILSLVVLTSGMLACASAHRASSVEGAPPDAPVLTIEVTAQKYRFDPSEIRVKRGTVVRLILQSRDVKHGIKIPHYRIDRDIYDKEEIMVTVVKFYAREVGTYDFRCSSFCGFGHWRMKGKIIVEE